MSSSRSAGLARNQEVRHPRQNRSRNSTSNQCRTRAVPESNRLIHMQVSEPGKLNFVQVRAMGVRGRAPFRLIPSSAGLEKPPINVLWNSPPASPPPQGAWPRSAATSVFNRSTSARGVLCMETRPRHAAVSTSAILCGFVGVPGQGAHIDSVTRSRCSSFVASSGEVTIAEQ